MTIFIAKSLLPRSGTSTPSQHLEDSSTAHPTIVLSHVCSLVDPNPQQPNVVIKQEIADSADAEDTYEEADIHEDTVVGADQPSPLSSQEQSLASPLPGVYPTMVWSAPPDPVTEAANDSGTSHPRDNSTSHHCGASCQTDLDKKTKLEVEVLLATKRKLRAEALFFQEERRRSIAATLLYEQEQRKAAAIADFHVEEKRKASAKADLFLEQHKTEVVRRRLLLLEIQKVRRELKVLQ